MDNLGLIIAIVGSAIAMIGVVIAMMFWCRGEANNLRNEAKDDRKDILQLIRSIEFEVKDFHNQLLKLEEKYLQLNEKVNSR